MITFGLEKEYFAFDSDDKLAVVPQSLRPDGCGYLAEARGKPFANPVEAVYSLLADEFNLKALASKIPLVLVDVPIMKVSKELKIKAAREYIKGQVHYQNFYGHECHKNKINEHTAGIHVSVVSTYSLPFNVGKNVEYKEYRTNFDWPRLFVHLDRVFAQEIKSAKRLPGFYELKHDGRVEYRSLPNNVDLYKLAEVLKEFKF